MSLASTTGQVRFVQKGEKGEQGNGIVSQTSYFVLSNRASGVTHDNTSGWDTAFPTPTEQLPYVWRSVLTTYSQTADEWSTAELVATYRSGVNQNLLDNAAFTGDSNLDAWVVKSLYKKDDAVVDGEKGSVAAGTNGRNAYHDTCRKMSSAADYKDVLAQQVYSDDIKKLEAGKWYTLSFWAKGCLQRIDINQESNAYGFGLEHLYLVAGVRYTISARGYVNQTAVDEGKKLMIAVYKSDWSESKGLEFTETSAVTKTMEFTPQTTGEYLLQSYYHDSSEPREGLAYVEWYKLEDGMDLDTYIYPSVVDTTQKMFVDGVETAAGSDLLVRWTLGDEWEFHKVSFRTKSDLSGSDGAALFRLLPTPCPTAERKLYICMPKLEQGMLATGFMDTPSDTKTPIYYPSGVYAADVGYTRTVKSAPIVEHEGQYYVLVKEGTFTGIDPKTDVATYGGKGTWDVMDKMQYAFIEVLFAKYAKLASAIFYGNYMFSQHGVDADGVSSSDYQNFDPATDAFTPNVLIDWLTGAGWFAKKNFKFNADGSIEIIGKVQTSSDGAKRIVIDPSSNSLSMYNSDGRLAATMYFSEGEDGWTNDQGLLKLMTYQSDGTISRRTIVSSDRIRSEEPSGTYVDITPSNVSVYGLAGQIGEEIPYILLGLKQPIVNGVVQAYVANILCNCWPSSSQAASGGVYKGKINYYDSIDETSKSVNVLMIK